MPPSVRPQATPLTPDQLQAELSKAPAAKPDPRPVETAQPRVEIPPVEQPVKVDTGKPSTNFMGKINEGMTAKKETKAEDKPAEKTPPAKKTAVSSDDAPPPAKKAEGAPDTELTADERGVLPHDSERTRKRILYFHGENKKLSEESAKLRAELEAARKAPPSAANAEEIEKLKNEHKAVLEEATRLRRRFDWENDPEAKSKYREPIAVAEKSVEETLKRNGFGEATLKAIKDSGGFAAFSRSAATYPIQVDDPDNPGQKKIVDYRASDLARGWLGRISIADAELIRQAVGKQEMLQAEEKEAIAKAQTEAGAYYETQTKAQREAAAQNEAALKKHQDEYSAWQGKVEKDTDWLQDRPVADDASPEDRAAAEEFNKTQAELRESLKKHPANALEYGQLKLDAARSKHLDRELTNARNRITELEEQVKKSRSALKTTPKSGSLLTKDGHKPQEPERKPGDTNWLAGLNKTMQRKIGGGDDE